MRSLGQPAWRLASAIVRSEPCRYCGSREDLVAHHRLPRRFGGPNDLSNLEPVCRSCHPRVEQEAAAEAELVWESPIPEGPRRLRRRPPLIPPY